MAVTVVACGGTAISTAEMPQHIPGNISSGCYIGSHINPHNGLQNPSSPDTSNPTDVNLSSAAQIGRRLAAIGDEFNRSYEKGLENKLAHVLRQSIRIVGNCQNFALSLLRSIKNITSRVDHGVTRTPGRRTLAKHFINKLNIPIIARLRKTLEEIQKLKGQKVCTRDPVTIYPKLLLLAALVVVFGLVIKLGLDD